MIANPDPGEPPTLHILGVSLNTPDSTNQLISKDSRLQLCVCVCQIREIKNVQCSPGPGMGTFSSYLGKENHTRLESKTAVRHNPARFKVCTLSKNISKTCTFRGTTVSHWGSTPTEHLVTYLPVKGK